MVGAAKVVSALRFDEPAPASRTGEGIVVPSQRAGADAGDLRMVPQQFLDEARCLRVISNQVDTALCPGEGDVKQAAFFRMRERRRPARRQDKIEQRVVLYLRREPVLTVLQVQHDDVVFLPPLGTVDGAEFDLKVPIPLGLDVRTAPSVSAERKHGNVRLARVSRLRASRWRM